MTVVLDSSALLTLAVDVPGDADYIEFLIRGEACYVVAAALIEMYLAVLQRLGVQQAEHWLNFASGGDFHVVDHIDQAMITTAAQALLLDGEISLAAAMTAAFARASDATVICTKPTYNALARAKFCHVARPPLER